MPNFHYRCPLYCPSGHYKTAKTIYAGNKCGICARAKEKVTRKRYPERNASIQWRGKLRRIFGLTVGDYELLLAQQGGKCAGCGISPTRLRLAVDHDHKTGKIRGLLCGRCNRALGLVRDSIVALEGLRAYLLSSQEVLKCPK